MKSTCLILLALAVYCNAAATRQKRQDEVGCVCDPITVPTNAGTMIGNCLTSDAEGPNGADKHNFWCYVADENCKQGGGLGESNRFWDKWVSYDLCDKKNGDANINQEKLGGEE